MPKFLKSALFGGLYCQSTLPVAPSSAKTVVVVRRYVEIAADREWIRLLTATHVRIELLEVDRVHALELVDVCWTLISSSGESRLFSGVRPKPCQFTRGDHRALRARRNRSVTAVRDRDKRAQRQSRPWRVTKLVLCCPSQKKFTQNVRMLRKELSANPPAGRAPAPRVKSAASAARVRAPGAWVRRFALPRGGPAPPRPRCEAPTRLRPRLALVEGPGRRLPRRVAVAFAGAAGSGA